MDAMNDTTDETAPVGGPQPGPQAGPPPHPQPGAPSGQPTGPTGAAYARHGLDDLDQLRRSSTDRHIAGVAGGLGRHFGIDPTIVRVLLVVLVFFGGAGLLMYGAVWLLVPEDGVERAAIATGPDARRTALILAAIVAACLAIGDAVNGFGFGWPLAIVALAVGAYLVLRDRRDPLLPPRQDLHQQGSSTPSSAFEEGTAMSTSYAPTGSGAADATTDPVSGGPTDAPPPWQPPTGRPPAYQPPRRPRRTGIVWFWPTLALIGIGLGILGVYDADHRVADGAYPALALAITGVMLVVGSLRGRPGGLILLGIVSALCLSATTVVGGSLGTDARQVHETPLTAAAVQPDYHHSVGEIELDLTQVQDPDALAGRTIDVELRTGSIRVIVPRELNVDVDASIAYGGDISVDGEHRGGWDTSVERRLSASPASGTEPLELNLESRFGQITVEQR